MVIWKKRTYSIVPNVSLGAIKGEGQGQRDSFVLREKSAMVGNTHVLVKVATLVQIHRNE